MAWLAAASACCVPLPRAPVAPRRPTADAASYDHPDRARSSVRGIHLSPKRLSDFDYAALDILEPEAVVVLSAQLGELDPTAQVQEDVQLQWWLASRPGILQIVRLWPVKSPDDPERLARRITRLHAQFPWLQWFQIANEPDIEWPDATWEQIAQWAADVWSHVERNRRSAANRDIRLLFPPFAQWSRLDPERVGYDRVRPVIELFLDHGDGIAGHEYWDMGHLYLVEDTWPGWLRARLGSVPFFVTECGRRPVPGNGPPDAAFSDELIGFAERTQARVVAPFVLSSAGGVFDRHDFVDRNGHLRPPVAAWGHWTRGLVSRVGAESRRQSGLGEAAHYVLT
jgi:hypothetical protein